MAVGSGAESTVVRNRDAAGGAGGGGRRWSWVAFTVPSCTEATVMRDGAACSGDG